MHVPDPLAGWWLNAANAHLHLIFFKCSQEQNCNIEHVEEKEEVCIGSAVG